MTLSRTSVLCASMGLAVALIGAGMLACSSSSTPGTPEPNDSGAASDTEPMGDGGHDGATAATTYGACAVKGSFGWTCAATTSGADPTDCTDPSYPDCFVGGQGAWCTTACTSATDCTAVSSDAGCIPTACNTRGYCK
jgi:hypothetical protein